MTTDYGVGENKEVLIMLERDTSVRLYMTDFEAVPSVDEAVWPAAFLHTLTTKTAVTENHTPGGKATHSRYRDARRLRRYDRRDDQSRRIRGRERLRNRHGERQRFRSRRKYHRYLSSPRNPANVSAIKEDMGYTCIRRYPRSRRRLRSSRLSSAS